MWQKLLWIGAAGGAGALARYAVAGLVQRLGGAGFPWGTLAVNLGGCLVFGCLWGIAGERWLLGPSARAALFVGFLGAFTTFSTFAFETGELVRDGEWGLAAANVILSNVLGLACVLGGAALGRLI